MTKASHPTLFVLHGAPTLALETGLPAYTFLAMLGKWFPGISAVLCISAHWNTPRSAVNAVTIPATLHDFSGFSGEFYGITYPAPEAKGKIIHQSWYWGNLGMGAYEFG